MSIDKRMVYRIPGKQTQWIAATANDPCHSRKQENHSDRRLMIMNTISDRLFDTVDRMTSSLGVVNNLIDGIVSRLSPTGTAKADCSGNYQVCSESCTTTKCFPFQCVNHLQTYYHLHSYVFTPSIYSQCSQTCYECTSECGTYSQAC
jgi:hypothetical protein